MKLENRTKTVEYKVYVAEDGKEFETEGECILYEKRLNGDVKDCPKCQGRGWVLVKVEDEDYHTGAPIVRTDSHTCELCNGKGYLERKTKIVWE